MKTPLYIYQNDLSNAKRIRKATSDEIKRYVDLGGFADDEGLVNGPDLASDLSGMVYLND